MTVHCPECEAPIALPEDLIATGVPKVRCRSCGARFRVLKGGTTLLLENTITSGSTVQPETGTGDGAAADSGAFGSEQSDAPSGVGREGAFDGPHLTVADPDLAASLRSGLMMDYPKLEIGRLFRDKWRIDREIGKGATAVVYRARDVDADIHVALKVVGVVGGQADGIRRAWAEEYKARSQVDEGSHLLIRLESPQVQEIDGTTYVALPQELGERSLRDWMNDTGGNLAGRRDRALAFFRQACRGVAALHRAGLVHLDLKPENLLLVLDGSGSGAEERIKIGDFGLARNLARLDQLDAGARRFGLGTPAYMAPEQIRSARYKDIGKPADLYALGVILHELIDGAPPFQGSADEVRDKHLEMTPERPEDIPEEYWEIIERCLDKKPRQRLQSPEELENMLDAAPARGEVIGKEKAEAERQARERRHEDHWRQANVLRDAEPDRALVHLQAILDDPPVSSHQRVSELRDELKKLAGKYGRTLDKARKAELDQPLPAAQEAWEDVLAIATRNPEAAQRIEQLRDKLHQFEKKRTEADVLADCGEFGQALENLARCLELDPNQPDLRPAIERMRKRQKAHDAALSKAHQQLEATRPDLALKTLEQATAEAPKSETAADLRETANQKVQAFELALRAAGQALESADFDEVRKGLRDMRKLIDPARKATNLEDSLKKIEPAYAEAMQQAELKMKGAEMSPALAAVEAALARCPKSQAASQLRNTIEYRQREQAEAERTARQRRHADHWHQAQSLREAEPDKALEHVQTILADPPVENEQQVIALGESLEVKCHAFQQALQQARAIAIDSPLAKSIKIWEQVLEVARRNQEAVARVNELRDKRKQFDESFAQSRLQADHGQFDQALESLSLCFELDPNDPDIPGLIEAASERRKVHDRAVAKSRQQLEKTRPDLASKTIDKAIAQAPRSESANDLKDAADSQIQLFEEELSSARRALEAADFDTVRSGLRRLRQLVHPSRKYSTLEARLQEIEPDFRAALGQAEGDIERLDLRAAACAVDKALGLCPKSQTARKLKSNIERQTRRFEDHLSAAREAVTSADFARGREALNSAEQTLQPAEEVLTQRETLEETEKAFTVRLDLARAGFRDGDLELAYDQAASALDICPASEPAKALQTRIDGNIDLARKRLAQAQRLLGDQGAEEEYKLSERFRKIRESLQEAQARWPKHQKLVELQESLDRRDERFQRLLAQVQKHLAAAAPKEAESCLSELERCERGQELEYLREKLNSSLHAAHQVEREQALKRKMCQGLGFRIAGAFLAAVLAYYIAVIFFGLSVSLYLLIAFALIGLAGWLVGELIAAERRTILDMMGSMGLDATYGLPNFRVGLKALKKNPEQLNRPLHRTAQLLLFLSLLLVVLVLSNGGDILAETSIGDYLWGPLLFFFTIFVFAFWTWFGVGEGFEDVAVRLILIPGLMFGVLVIVISLTVSFAQAPGFLVLAILFVCIFFATVSIALNMLVATGIALFAIISILV